jgi:hypothetical protein
MKKISIPILMLLLLGASGLWAQDSKVTTGVVAYQGQDFEKAIKAFDEGLKDPSLLREKNLPKAYYYRAMSNLMWMSQQNTPEKMEAQKDKLDGILFHIYGDFKKALETDTQNKWEKKVNQQLQNLSFALLRGGVMALDLASGDKLTESEKEEAFTEAIKYMDLVEEVDPTNFTTNDVRAQAQLNLGDSANAYKSFQAAADKYSQHPPKQPDQMIAYVYYRLALLNRYYKNDIDAALQNLDQGKKNLEKEHARFMEKKESLPAERVQQITDQYNQAKEYMTKFELDLLLNSPDKLQQALDKFESAIAKEPKNYILHVAYAQLLEKTDEAKAEEIYKKATEVDPKKQIAWFNLGALYVNKGVALYKEANDISDDFDKAKALQTQGDEYYRQAFPFLQKALEIEPCDKPTLQALMNICINLSMSDEAMATEYKKYKDKKAECGL